MSTQSPPPNLNALEQLELFLRWDNYLRWSQRHAKMELAGTPVIEDEQFQIELEALVQGVTKELHDVIKIRYSDLDEHSARAKFYGLRLNRVLNHVQQSHGLKRYKDIVEGQFKLLENTVSYHLGLELHFSDTESITKQAVEREEKTNRESDDTKKNKVAIQKYFGYWTKSDSQNHQIMSEADFSRFNDLLLDSLANQKAPTNIVKFSKLRTVSNGEIRGKFYDLHSELYGTSHIFDFIIDFMREVFQQMDKVDKAKFSVKPKKYPLN